MSTDSGRTVELKDITFRAPLPIPHMEPNGHLPMTKEGAALWMFLVCAFQALDRVEKQTTLEGTPDQVADLMQIAHSIRKMYEFDESDGLEKMFNAALVACARKEAFRSRLPWDGRIDAFFASGGKSYRVMDRNPDKVGL